jgi:PHP family Zn ribbon phosphoesterase
MRFDLHIHSCLSPCADRDMSPRAVVRRACEAGLDAIALCDHNSARNAPAFQAACAAEGLYGLYGLEISAAEQLHVLTVFDTPADALAMTEQVYAALPGRSNVPERFGHQQVMDADDRLEDVDWNPLILPTTLHVRDIGAAARKLGGLVIAAHADRPEFSIFSELKLLRGDEGFDAMELSDHAGQALWRQHFAGLPVLCASDAHQLRDIGCAWNEADLPRFCVASLRAALAGGAVHCVTR